MPALFQDSGPWETGARHGVHTGRLGQLQDQVLDPVHEVPKGFGPPARVRPVHRRPRQVVKERAVEVVGRANAHLVPFHPEMPEGLVPRGFEIALGKGLEASAFGRRFGDGHPELEDPVAVQHHAGRDSTGRRPECLDEGHQVLAGSILDRACRFEVGPRARERLRAGNEAKLSLLPEEKMHGLGPRRHVGAGEGRVSGEGRLAGSSGGIRLGPGSVRSRSASPGQQEGGERSTAGKSARCKRAPCKRTLDEAAPTRGTSDPTEGPHDTGAPRITVRSRDDHPHSATVCTRMNPRPQSGDQARATLTRTFPPAKRKTKSSWSRAGTPADTISR